MIGLIQGENAVGGCFMLNIILVEDIPYFLKEIEDYIKNFFIQCDYVYRIYTFSEYNDDFFQLIDQNLENVLCLFDIETKRENGIDVARKIRQYNQDLEIMFLTAHDTDEYKHRIVINNIKSMGFISKDKMYQDLYGKMQEFINNVKSKECIHIQDGRSEYSLSLKDINYITTSKYEKKTSIHTISGEVLISLPLKEVEKILTKKSKYFVKVHRSFVINILKIMTLNIAKKQIVFFNHEEVNSISRNHKEHLLNEWNKFHNFQEKSKSCL